MFTLSPLPYQLNALEPVVSARTLDFHYNKHHKGYVDKLNELVQGTRFASMTLEDIIGVTADDVRHRKIFNNAAQVWNHDFFWKCLAPGATGPSSAMMGLLKDNFGGLEAFKEQFVKVATDQFGSGYAWLVQLPGGRLEIAPTSNAENPLITEDKPLLCLDVWEHAYYLDYQNRRPDFAKSVADRLLNWDFAERNLGAASPQAGFRSQRIESTLRH